MTKPEEGLTPEEKLTDDINDALESMEQGIGEVVFDIPDDLEVTPRSSTLTRTEEPKALEVKETSRSLTPGLRSVSCDGFIDMNRSIITTESNSNGDNNLELVIRALTVALMPRACTPIHPIIEKNNERLKASMTKHKEETERFLSDVRTGLEIFDSLYRLYNTNYKAVPEDTNYLLTHLGLQTYEEDVINLGAKLDQHLVLRRLVDRVPHRLMNIMTVIITKLREGRSKYLNNLRSYDSYVDRCEDRTLVKYGSNPIDVNLHRELIFKLYENGIFETPVVSDDYTLINEDSSRYSHDLGEFFNHLDEITEETIYDFIKSREALDSIKTVTDILAYEMKASAVRNDIINHDNFNTVLIDMLGLE